MALDLRRIYMRRLSCDQPSLGSLFGVEIDLYYSWFLISALIMMSLAAQYDSMNPQWGTAAVWALSALTVLLFFACLVAHELSHSLVAKARRLEVRSITLFALGGSRAGGAGIHERRNRVLGRGRRAGDEHGDRDRLHVDSGVERLDTYCEKYRSTVIHGRVARLH